LEITSSSCLGNEVYLTGGFPNTPPVERTVKLLTPTCRQTLMPGDTFSIIWTGLLPQDVIQLEYSLNNGKTWDTLARNLTDLVYKWIVPNVQSDQCLIRAIQLWPNNVGRTLDLQHQGEVNTAFFNNEGNQVITASSDNSLGIWNANSGKIIHWLKDHTAEVKYAVFSPKDDKVASIGMDSKLIIWDVATGKNLLSKDLSNLPQSVNYSPDGSKIVVACNSGCASVYNADDLSEVVVIPAHQKTGVCWYAEFSPDGTKVLTAGNDGVAKVWDWKDDITKPVEEYDTRFSGYGNIIHATYNSNASKIAISSWTTKKLYVFDTKTKDTLYTVTHNDNPDDNKILNSSSFNVDPKYGERLLTAAQDNVRLWDGNTGIPANPHIIQEHRESVRTAKFNFDATRILTASWDSTAKIWNLQQRDLQMDTTDCTFRIKPLTLELASIDFPPVPVNDSKDSIITQFIINKSDFNFEIRNLELIGNSNGDFQIIRQEQTPFTLDTLAPASITLLFRPSKPGFITDTIKVTTGGGTFSAILTGTGIDKGLYSYTNLIDFGQIELGDSKDTVIQLLVINKSVADIEINSNKIQMPDTLHFSLVNDIDKKVLKPQETAGLTLRYTPSALEINNGTLALEHNGNLSPLKVSLLGEGTAPRIDTLTLAASDITGEPGEIVEMPIYIRNVSSNGLRYSLSGFQTNLRFNASLLLPLDFFPSYLDGKDRIMQLNLPAKFASDSVLAILKFKVALGNDTICKMNLEYSSPIGLGKVLMHESDGEFKLKGYCKDADPRLFDAEGRVALSQAFPNPAGSIVQINFNLVETDLTKLYIVDLNGKIVKSIFNEVLVKGEHSLNLNLSDLPSGKYSYILETPTRKFTKSLIIER
jgi:WD40 repeat protein